MQHSFFAGLDLWVVLYAAGMALLVSGLTTIRARQAQRLSGMPLSSWLTAIPDTLTGAFVGTFLAVIVPKWYAGMNNFTGVSLLAAGGGIACPYMWDLVSSKQGIRSILYAIGQSIAGPLGKGLVALAPPRKEGDDDGQNPTPPSSH